MVVSAVGARRIFDDVLEMPVEIGEVLESAFVTNIRNTLAGFSQHFTGLPYPHFNKKTGKSFVGPRFKIPAERMGTQVGYFRYFAKRNIL